MDLQKMSAVMLLENYRSLVRGTGNPHTNGVDKARMSKDADRYEEEILRRMAW